MTAEQVDATGAGAADALRDAAAELQDAQAAVEEYGGAEDIRTVESALRSARRLLSGYEDSATGTGDFQSYVEFQEEFASHVEGLPDDLPEREAFEAALDAVEKRRLSESDFAAAREALAPAADAADVLERKRDARSEFEQARRRARDRVDAVADGVAERERVLELGEADLDAPVDELREPIEAYDDAVLTAFGDYRRTENARGVLELAVTAAAYPLVDVDAPPGELLEYVREHDAGDHTIPELVEYADYSTSKLEHYVDDPAALKRAVGTRRTYLDRLDGSGFAIGWPPPAGETLKHVTRELLSVVSRFADEETAAALREVRELAWREDYDDVRTTAVALDELGPRQRDRLESGTVDAELERLREEREALEAALSETDDLA